MPAPPSEDSRKTDPRLPKSRSSTTSLKKDEKTGIVSTVILYIFGAFLLISYCGYAYDQDAFKSNSQRVAVLKPLVVLFDLIETYSPFHQFIDDEAFLKKTRGKPNDGAKNGVHGYKRVFTSQELMLFDGRDETKALYLAILGQVFDVSKGREHYSPDGGYGFFVGKDASRAFVTGDFDPKGLTDDVLELPLQSYLVSLY